MEAELRKFFGWRDGSHMPAIYVHLALEDMRDRVRRDAGVDALGYSNAVETGDEIEKLKMLLRKIVAEPASRTKRRL